MPTFSHGLGKGLAWFPTAPDTAPTAPEGHPTAPDAAPHTRPAVTAASGGWTA